MKESFDKELKERIIKVFDDYDDNGAEQGWQELRKKYPAKPYRRIILWWSSAAAVLAVTGTFLFFNLNTSDDVVLSTNKTPKTINKDTATNQRSGLRGSKIIAHKETFSQENAPAVSSHKRDNINAAELAAVATVQKSKDIEPNTLLAQADLPTETLPTYTDTQNIDKQTINPKIAVQETAPVAAKLSEEKFQPNTDAPLIQNNIIEHAPVVAGSNSLNEDYKQPIKRDKKPRLTQEKEVSENNKFELSFYAGPFLNYAEGSSNSMNMGAGVSSGISLTKRFTLVAGLALANNKLVFNNEVPANSYAAFLNNSFMDKSSQSLLVTNTVPQISKLEAQLLNLDIPINIKYSISREPDKVFVTAGVSSFTYLNEAYSYSYNNVVNGSNTFSSSRNEVINKNFGKFDLAQTLNLSFGLTHTAKVQSFVFEPFVKYPIGALGSQNIRFGSAGINFKLSIHPAVNRTK